VRRPIAKGAVFTVVALGAATRRGAPLTVSAPPVGAAASEVRVKLVAVESEECLVAGGDGLGAVGLGGVASV
jgi:hypothetical protein